MKNSSRAQPIVQTWRPNKNVDAASTVDHVPPGSDTLIATDAALNQDVSQSDYILRSTDTPTKEDANTPDHGVSVNGVEITARDINIESANYAGGTILERQNQAAIALVIRELLSQRADELGLPATRAGVDEDAVIDQLLEQELDIPEPNDAACRRYFDNHPDAFHSPDLFEVAHILLAADPRDDDARTLAKEKARAAIQMLAADPSRFAELAADLSDCPSRNTGGNMGQIGKGQTVPEFEDVLFRMRQDELSASPVESRYGFHVIYVRRRIDGIRLDYATARDQIAHYLRKSVQAQALSQYLRILAGRAAISGIELEGSKTPLLQ